MSIKLIRHATVLIAAICFGHVILKALPVFILCQIFGVDIVDNHYGLVYLYLNPDFFPVRLSWYHYTYLPVILVPFSYLLNKALFYAYTYYINESKS